MNPEVFIRRRRDFQSRLKQDDVALLFSSPPQLKSNDVHYRFRQNSDLFYLTGFCEEDCALIVSADTAVLFLRPHDPSQETWFGDRLGVESAVDELGVDDAFPIGELPTRLGDFLKNRGNLYYHFGRVPDQDRLVFTAVEERLRRSRRGEYAPVEIKHPALLLHEMRLVKSAEEIGLLREAVAITARAHRRVRENLTPGLFEYELEAWLHYEFRRSGAWEAYPSIVASGQNACILHYTANDCRIGENDLVLIDAGAEKDCMNADVTRTLPASGKFTGPQRTIYEIVLAAQKKAIASMSAGRTPEEIHQQTVREMVEALCAQKILADGIEEIMERESYKEFYMHGTGHWLGLDVHDVGSYQIGGKSRPLENGMISTVEPGLYFHPGLESVPPEFRGIGVRIEDDVLVNGDTPENLTAAIPKELSDLEN